MMSNTLREAGAGINSGLALTRKTQSNMIMIARTTFKTLLINSAKRSSFSGSKIISFHPADYLIYMFFQSFTW